MDVITVRASSMPELFDCPARWEAKYVRGLRMPRSAAAQLGTAVHAGTALFDQRVLDCNPLTADEAAGAVVDAIHHPDRDVDWGEDSPSEAEKIGIALHKRYCAEIAPQQTYVAVEATCERLEISDLGLALTGTTDRVTLSDEGYGIADLKTGKRAVAADGTVETAGHAAQIGVYELLAGAALGQPIEAPAKIHRPAGRQNGQGPARGRRHHHPRPRAARGRRGKPRPAANGRRAAPCRALLRQPAFPTLFQKILSGLRCVPVEEVTCPSRPVLQNFATPRQTPPSARALTPSAALS